MITLLFVLNAWAAPNSLCTTPPPSPAAFVRAQKEAEIALKKFANSKDIAPDADTMLGKLIEAKSPTATAWIARHSKAGESEDDIAHAWREYYAQYFVLGRYPNPKTELDPKIESYVEKLYRTALPEREQARLKRLFDQVRAQALKTLTTFPMPAEQLKAIRDRLSQVELVFLKKLASSPFAKSPLEAIAWGVAYDPVPNRINVGIDVLQYSSDSNVFAVMAHELGHAIDPCRWSAFFSGKNPFAPIVSCLRTKESVQALPRDDSRIDALVKSGKLDAQLKAALEANPTCNKLEYPPIGVQADQSLEAFADWFSAEVVSSASYVPLGIRPDLCNARELNPGSAYPTNEARLERIYFAQPILRKAVELPAKGAPKYCTFPPS